MTVIFDPMTNEELTEFIFGKPPAETDKLAEILTTGIVSYGGVLGKVKEIDRDGYVVATYNGIEATLHIDKIESVTNPKEIVKCRKKQSA